MIHPIMHFPIKGALWYQGEANGSEGDIYFAKMRALIGGWRRQWGLGDFPFDHTGKGLMVGKKDGRSPAVENNAGKLQRFAIAGADKKWFWAQAEIVNDTVSVSSPEVKEPVAVRYAFEMNPDGANLYNRDGLPASPFRTDDW